MNAKQEKLLRNNIRQLIEVVKQKNEKKEQSILTEEEQLRSIVRVLINHERQYLTEIATADIEPTPNKSTGINVLEDLLKKIVPVLQIDYKLLTTDPDQRQSFRAHIINAVINTLTPAEANNAAGEEETLEEEVDIEIGGADNEKFIDIRTDAEKSDDDEEVEEDPRDEFGSGVKGSDETGRNVAYSAFKKIENSIIDSYELLSNAEDQELFYDYLIANLKLYFDKFEKELSTDVEEPTNQAYDTAKSEQGAEATDTGDLGGEEEELDLEL
tara:strand:- start:58 stop:870 length:813 start_codon:yes stop_codon:yes gene_type:complete